MNTIKEVQIGSTIMRLIEKVFPERAITRQFYVVATNIEGWPPNAVAYNRLVTQVQHRAEGIFELRVDVARARQRVAT